MDARDLGIDRTRRYYTPREVSLHNSQKDCWVSIFGNVFNITQLIADETEQGTATLVDPLVKYAGKDLSSWFDKETLNVKHHVDPVRKIQLPYLPHGRFVHVAPLDPVAGWRTDFETPWWQDYESYCVGKLSERTREIQILNMLTKQVTQLEVCGEETLDEIQARYTDWNSHSSSYTWKIYDGEDQGFRRLDMNATLEENDIPDETEELLRLGIDPHEHIPTIHAYFNDDLTVG